MTLEEYITRIRFRFWRPDSDLRWYHRLAWRAQRLGISLEMANTQLPADRLEARQRLRELCAIPRMSTYAIAALIDKAVSSMLPGQAFVNVGVWHGFSFLAGCAANPGRACIGIDNFSQFGGPREAFQERFSKHASPLHTFADMDYQEYFQSHHRGEIGFYIYDGEHSYANQLRALELAERVKSLSCARYAAFRAARAEDYG